MSELDVYLLLLYTKKLWLARVVYKLFYVGERVPQKRKGWEPQLMSKSPKQSFPCSELAVNHVLLPVNHKYKESIFSVGKDTITLISALQI